MQGGDFSQSFSMSMESIMSIKDQLIYDQYKKERQSYQKIEMVEQLVNKQISRFPRQDDFRQSARHFYDYVSKHAASQKLPAQQPLNLAGSKDSDGVSLFFVYNHKKNHHQSMIPQTESSKTAAEQSLFQEEKLDFTQNHAQQMKRRTSYLVERLQNQIKSGEYRNLMPYLDSRNLTLGVLRKALRDCIRTSLLYQHYAEQINQECKHQDDSCQKQKSFINKIYEMQTQAINKLFPEGKQSLLRQILAENYDSIFNRSQFLKKMKKTQKKDQEQ